MAVNLKRSAIKFGSGFLSGLVTGGWTGAFAGGTAAAVTGGKAKPLKSALIGGGVGFASGVAAEKLGYQGSTTRIGGLEFSPLSSMALKWYGDSPAPQTATAADYINSRRLRSSAPGTPSSGLYSDLFKNMSQDYAAGNALPAPGPGTGIEAGFAADEESSDWLSVAAIAGLALLAVNL